MKIAVVIPCYRVSAQILGVISRIGNEASRIYVIDDKCPENSGKLVAQSCTDPRIKVIYNEDNLGVGGAVMAGYREALRENMDIVVKIDGDGQMDPGLLGRFIAPLVNGRADYTKGNRFFSIDMLSEMPRMRLFGNSVVSFISKLASGYWNVMDPANGYTAIHCSALSSLPLAKIDNGYFFESDMLFRLYTIRAVVEEVPMDAHYGDEKSSLNIQGVGLRFPGKYLVCLIKRIFYSYFLRDFNICSLEMVAGFLLMLWGTLFGGYRWYTGIKHGVFASSGTVMLAAMPFILGFQLMIAAISFDVMNVPSRPLQGLIRRRQ